MATITEIKPEERRFAIHLTSRELELLKRCLRYTGKADPRVLLGLLNAGDQGAAIILLRHLE